MLTPFKAMHPRRELLVFFTALMGLAGMDGMSAQEPPADFGKPDSEIKISVIPGQMKYDTSLFAVKPGGKVKLTFTNPDVMQHNFVICRPGKDVITHVAQAAATMGGDAIRKQFIPDTPEILFHTPMVDPGQSSSIYFIAPAKEEDYPFVCTFPGHSLVMNGIMKVTLSEVEAAPPPAAKPATPTRRGEIEVTDEPRVIRVLLPDTAPSSMAVGLVGGFNYCFDIENCAVRYGWTGPFLNVSPDLDGRGGKSAKVLGQRFDTGFVNFPIRIGTNDKPVVKFIGYRIKAVPEILFSVDGVIVTQTVTQAPGSTLESPALQYSFSIPHAPAAVRFMTKPGTVHVTSPAGVSDLGLLTIPAKSVGALTLTLTPAHPSQQTPKPPQP